MGFGIKDGNITVDFRLEGHLVWREIQITDMASTKTTTTTLLVSFLQVMASSIVQAWTTFTIELSSVLSLDCHAQNTFPLLGIERAILLLSNTILNFNFS